LIGYLSWAFEEKTNIKLAEFKNFICKNPGFDVYFINPFPELVCLYDSVWEQGEFYHPGIIKLAQKLLIKADLQEIDLGNVKNDLSTAAYSNYWVANYKFWNGYMNFTLRIFDAFESLSPNEKKEFLADSSYHTGVGYIPFIMERMFSTYLFYYGSEYKVKLFKYSDKQMAELLKSLRVKAKS
jgi:hypothetical protein